MKQYIQFWERNLSGELWESIGSDGYCPLDGRLNLQNATNEAFRIMEKCNIEQKEKR